MNMRFEILLHPHFLKIQFRNCKLIETNRNEFAKTPSCRFSYFSKDNVNETSLGIVHVNYATLCVSRAGKNGDSPKVVAATAALSSPES